ncbi:MAG: RNA-directed DNA polymerase [Bacteroidales bacterium]|nr:RNA-directed DNA polymerase [Bacteroidales bacterium]
MKRLGNIFDSILSLDNLKLAFYKAQKRKTLLPDVVAFRNNLDVELSQIRTELESGLYRPSEYRRFIIREPKERLICAAPFRDRVVHHALMNLCEGRFEQHLIPHTCACRKGKGTDYALKIARDFKKKWFLKLDIHKYFDSISHDKMYNHLETLFKDKRLLSVFRVILDSYETVSGRGIPIGNLTSQYFANAFLSNLDHYIKEKLRCTEYVRYMDDFVLCSNDKEQLKDWLGIVREKVQQIGLELNKPFMNRVCHGFPFIGYRISFGNVRLGLRAKKRFRKKYKFAEHQLNKGFWDSVEYRSHVSPLVACLKRAEHERFFTRVVGF